MRITARRITGNHIWVADSECSEERNPNIVPCNSASHCDAQITPSKQFLMPSRKNLTKNWRIIHETRKKFATVLAGRIRARVGEAKSGEIQRRRRRKRRFTKDGEETANDSKSRQTKETACWSLDAAELKAVGRTDERRNGGGEQVEAARSIFTGKRGVFREWKWENRYLRERYISCLSYKLIYWYNFAKRGTRKRKNS